ncbi:MAG TPA: PatB family C-S lyase [Bacteroidales bacterium]|nr:PatB family C-S lyase [Bacteroidales bacterium]
MNPDFDEHVAREGTYCVKYDLRQEVFGKENIIPMWVADMDFKTPDFVTSALKNRVEHEIFGYSIRPHQYYSSIIDWIQERHGWKIEKDWICFTPGVVPALNFCTLAFTNPGDSIIVQPPVYFPFFSAVESHGRKLIYNRLKENNGRWEMDFDNLESVIKPDTRMIIISNPHNPIGRVWRKEELEKLANLCLKNNIIIVSDEIHCDLVLPGYRHTPLASLSPDISSLTVTLTAPSKTFNLAGLSTSSVIIESKKLRQSFTNVTEKLHTGYGNLFGTIASIAAYSYGHEWLDSLLFYLQENINMVERFCMDNLPEIRPVHPEATYMIWLDCRKSGIDEKKLHDFFISKASVGMNEGSTFGPGGEGFMRMNIGTQRSIVLKALNQIKTAFSETMKNNERNNKG